MYKKRLSKQVEVNSRKAQTNIGRECNYEHLLSSKILHSLFSSLLMQADSELHCVTKLTVPELQYKIA